MAMWQAYVKRAFKLRNVLTCGKTRKENVCLQALIQPECVCLDRKGRMDVLELESCMKLACRSSFLNTKVSWISAQKSDVAHQSVCLYVWGQKGRYEYTLNWNQCFNMYKKAFVPKLCIDVQITWSSVSLKRLHYCEVSVRLDCCSDESQLSAVHVYTEIDPLWLVVTWA